MKKSLMKLLAIVVVLGGSFFALSEANAGVSRTVFGDPCKIKCTGFSNACGPKCKTCFEGNPESKQATSACCHDGEPKLTKNKDIAYLCAGEEAPTEEEPAE